MNAFHPSIRKVPRPDTRRLFIETFRTQIAAIEQGRARFRIPESRSLYERHANMAYHFKPELFVQLGGTTEFVLPGQRFTLGPGEVCVMPKGVPHGEVARAGERAFENVVICFYNETVAIHVAHESPALRPSVDDIFFFTTNHYGRLVEFLDAACEYRFHHDTAREAAIKGLLLAEFGLLLSVVEERESQLYSESERVSRCQWLIRNNIGDPELNVNSLAAELRCTADHLSKLFHERTGERIVEYITRIRVHCAVDAMQHTLLSVKEIAAACGFADPNYFARVFRKIVGQSPVQFRQDKRSVACALERDPKVVYFEREEHNFGLRPDVMARAEARLSPP